MSRDYAVASLLFAQVQNRTQTQIMERKLFGAQLVSTRPNAVKNRCKKTFQKKLFKNVKKRKTNLAKIKTKRFKTLNKKRCPFNLFNLLPNV